MRRDRLGHARGQVKPSPRILIRWDIDYWSWQAIVNGKVDAFGGTDRNEDPSIKPDADDVVRWAQEQGARVEWDVEVVWVDSAATPPAPATASSP